MRKSRRNELVSLGEKLFTVFETLSCETPFRGVCGESGYHLTDEMAKKLGSLGNG
jgi:hypothetical protein